MIKGIKKYGKADRRCDMGNYIVVWGIMLLLIKTHKKSHTGQTCDPNQSGRTATLLDRVHKTIKYVGLPIMGRGEFALNLGFVN